MNVGACRDTIDQSQFGRLTGLKHFRDQAAMLGVGNGLGLLFKCHDRAKCRSVPYLK